MPFPEKPGVHIPSSEYLNLFLLFHFPRILLFILYQAFCSRFLVEDYRFGRNLNIGLVVI